MHVGWYRLLFIWKRSLGRMVAVGWHHAAQSQLNTGSGCASVLNTH